MKKLIYNKFDKPTIATLKRVVYHGKIVVINTPMKRRLRWTICCHSQFLAWIQRHVSHSLEADISNALYVRW